MDAPFEIFLAAPPGLEPLARRRGRRPRPARRRTPSPAASPSPGGWPEVWRANLHLRGASRVLARIAAFRALHLAQLDKRARKLPWADTLRPDVPLRIEATCHRSRIYHAGAARQRIATAIAETLGAPVPDDRAETPATP